MDSVIKLFISVFVGGLMFNAHACIQPKVTLLAVNDNPPYSFIDKNGQLKGIEVAIVKLLLSQYQVKAEFISIPSGSCSFVLKESYIDGVLNFSGCEAQLTDVWVSPSLFIKKISLINHESRVLLLSDFLYDKKLRLGVKGANKFVLKNWSELIRQVFFLRNSKTTVHMLQRKRVDAVVTDPLSFFVALPVEERKNYLVQEVIQSIPARIGIKRSSVFLRLFKQKIVQDIASLRESGEIDHIIIEALKE